MPTSDVQYITDDSGQRVGVQIGLARYRQLVEALEELEAIRAYDAAKASGEQTRPFESMVREVEEGWNTQGLSTSC